MSSRQNINSQQVVFDGGNKICYKWLTTLNLEQRYLCSKSDQFSMSANNALKFELSLHGTPFKNYDTYLTIGLSKNSSKREKIVVLLWVKGIPSQDVDITDCENPYIFKNFIKVSNQCLSSISIYCYIKWYGNFDELQVPSSGVLSTPDGLKSFFNNKSLSDVVIDINGEELDTHKIILASQSPVFMAMFNSNMKEANENRITINDIDSDIMKLVLKYLYTCDTSFKDDIKTVLRVLAAADQYQIETLKAACSVILFEELKPDNAMDILRTISRYNVPKLLERVITFIFENKKNIPSFVGFEVICCRNPKLLFKLMNCGNTVDDVIHKFMHL